MASIRDHQFFNSSPSGGIHHYPATVLTTSNSFEFDESEIWNNTTSNNNPDQFSDKHGSSIFNSSTTSNKSSYQTIPIPITSSSRLRKSASSINRSGSNNRKKVGDRIPSLSSPPSSTTSSSLPVNIPDWSKIMGQAAGEQYHHHHANKAAGGGGYGSGYGYGYGYGCGYQNNNGVEVDEEGEEDWVPPHEYTARQLARRSGMVVAFSVHEGIGRTLKGRDLSRVRNAIWKQTGFED